MRPSSCGHWYQLIVQTISSPVVAAPAMAASALSRRHGLDPHHRSAASERLGLSAKAAVASSSSADRSAEGSRPSAVGHEQAITALLSFLFSNAPPSGGFRYPRVRLIPDDSGCPTVGQHDIPGIMKRCRFAMLRIVDVPKFRRIAGYGPTAKG